MCGRRLAVARYRKHEYSGFATNCVGLIAGNPGVWRWPMERRAAATLPGERPNEPEPAPWRCLSQGPDARCNRLKPLIPVLVWEAPTFGGSLRKLIQAILAMGPCHADTARSAGRSTPDGCAVPARLMPVAGIPAPLGGKSGRSPNRTRPAAAPDAADLPWVWVLVAGAGDKPPGLETGVPQNGLPGSDGA